MLNQIRKNMKKRIRSFGYAGRGIRVVFESEANMKIHIVISLFVLAMGFLFHINEMEWIMCLLCMGLVMGMEMLNTAIETIIDLVSPEFHTLAGKAKDIAAGAVLICAISSVIVGLLIFLPKVWCFIHSFIL
jgi:diacylglycerol kinase